MAWPSASARTKTWGTEILTSSDLQTQYDILHTYNNDQLSGTTGHGHTGSTNDGKQLSLTSAITGVLPTTNGGTNISSYTQGDILYSSAANVLSKLGAGTTGQYLQTQGAAANPQWATLPPGFGSWTSKTVTTIYQAATDGIVCATSTAASQVITLIGITDSSATPSTQRAFNRATSSSSTNFISITFPVKKNDYYQVTNGSDSAGTTTMFFLPLGS